MPRKNHDCGIGPAFEAVGGKWKAAILWELAGQPVRFGELRRRVKGVTEKMLIQQLRELERDQLVTRTVYHEVPPRVEYSLTPWGISLNAALGPIADWGDAYARAMAREENYATSPAAPCGNSGRHSPHRRSVESEPYSGAGQI